MKPIFAWSELDEGLESGDWPRWLPYGSFVMAALATVLTFIQRMTSPGLVGVVIALAFAFAPFALDAVGYVTGRMIGLPLWLIPLPVLGGTAFLVLHQPRGGDVSPFILVFMAAEVVARSTERRWLGAATVIASCVVVALPDALGITKGFSVWVMAVLFASGGGLLVRMLTERTLELRRAQEDLAEKAVSDELARIARELHDVIAHSMSVTMLHITAARMALENDKPDQALDALHEAERQGRGSMSDIRRTVGLLGSGDSAEPPMPGASDLPKLVNDFRAAGLDVDFRMDGDHSDLAPAAGLTLYRIVQESLTNVAKHAPGASTTVRLSLDNEIRLVVTNGKGITNGTTPDGSGLGLRGMVERATMLDGQIIAGPTADGWTVELTAPR